MHYPDLSTSTTVEHHTVIAQLLAEEDHLPVAQRQHNVRDTLDWRRHADAFEAEMTRRGLPFQPIGW
jgi:hypothetical protein